MDAAVDRNLLAFAVDLADRAGRLAVDRFYAADFSVTPKPDGTEVTEADHAVEALIRDEIRRHFPDDAVYGEEAGSTTGTSGRRWVVDPINGTFYFAHRIPIFTVVIAVEDEDGPAVGVLNQPIARQMIYAGRGRGCRVRTGDVEAAPVLRKAPALAQAQVEMVNPHVWPTGVLTTLHRNARACGYTGGVAGLLTGVIDAVMIAGTEMGYEGLAALPVIVEEAGGRVTDLTGAPLLEGSGTALLSTGAVHDDLIDLIRPVLAVDAAHGSARDRV
jgi:histidinol-phosphatase